MYRLNALSPSGKVLQNASVSVFDVEVGERECCCFIELFLTPSSDRDPGLVMNPCPHLSSGVAACLSYWISDSDALCGVVFLWFTV